LFFILLWILSNQTMAMHSNLVQISWRCAFSLCVCSPLNDWDAGCCYWGCSWGW